MKCVECPGKKGGGGGKAVFLNLVLFFFKKKTISCLEALVIKAKTKLMLVVQCKQPQSPKYLLCLSD